MDDRTQHTFTQWVYFERPSNVKGWQMEIKCSYTSEFCLSFGERRWETWGGVILRRKLEKMIHALGSLILEFINSQCNYILLDCYCKLQTSLRPAVLEASTEMLKKRCKFPPLTELKGKTINDHMYIYKLKP